MYELGIMGQTPPATIRHDYNKTKMLGKHTLGLAIQAYIIGDYDGARRELRAAETIYNLAAAESSDVARRNKIEERASDIVKMILNHRQNIETIKQNGKLQERIHTILNRE